jgi:hypothetical protein
MKELKIKSPQNRWGIVVGVDEYANANDFLHNLQGCVVDARRMYSVMTDPECCRFLEDHVRLLDDNPTFGDVEEAFAEIGEKMTRGDELWFYFAGHGYSEKKRHRDNGYLLLSGAKYDSRGFLRAEGSMSNSQLRDLVSEHVRADGATVVFFLDCCCAASVGLNTGDRAVVEATQLEDIATSFRDLVPEVHGDDCAASLNLMSFMATGKYGRAQEDRNGGAFTTRLIEGLRGGTCAHPTVFESYLVTAGALGTYLGATTTAQCPAQQVFNPMYPLSIAPEKKKAIDQIRELDGNVKRWLSELEGCVHDKQFAERVLVKEENFEFAGVMRNVLRLVSDPRCPFPVVGEHAASLLKAFRTLKDLLDRPPASEPPSGPRPDQQRRRAKDDSAHSDESLSHADWELLHDVERRLARAGFDLDCDGLTTRAAAAEALNGIGRARLRSSIGSKAPVALLFPNRDERVGWGAKAKNGFSELEMAVYRLVEDDNVLAGKR